MKRLILEFIGGCWDGMNLASPSPDPVEARLARVCFAETEDGTIGRLAVVSPEYATRMGTEEGNKYVVVHRMNIGGEVLVRLELCCEDQTADCPCHVKRIVLEFEGGHLHGLRLDSGSPDLNEALLASSCYCLTDQGEPGKGLGHFPMLPHLCREGNVRPCTGDQYRVVGREEEEDRVAVLLRYRPEAPGGVEGP